MTHSHTHTHLKVGRYKFKRVQEFIYLRSRIIQKNEIWMGIRTRIRAKNRCFYGLNEALKSKMLSKSHIVPTLPNPNTSYSYVRKWNTDTMHIIYRKTTHEYLKKESREKYSAHACEPTPDNGECKETRKLRDYVYALALGAK